MKNWLLRIQRLNSDVLFAVAYGSQFTGKADLSKQTVAGSIGRFMS